MEETKVGMMLEAETKDLMEICEKLVKVVGYELEKGIKEVDTEEMKEAIDMIKDMYDAKEKLVKACYYKYIMEAMEKAEEEKEEGGEDEEMMEDGRRGYRGQPRSESGRFMSRGDGRRSNRGGRGRGGSRRGYEDMMMYDEDEDWEEMERMRDFDRSSGKMYYSGSGSSGGSSGGGSSQGGGQSSGGMSGGSSGGGGSMGYSESGRGSQGGRGGERDSREGRSGQSRRGYMEAKEQGKDKATKMKELEDYMKSMAEDLTEAIEGATPEERAMAKNKLSVLVQKM